MFSTDFVNSLLANAGMPVWAGRGSEIRGFLESKGIAYGAGRAGRSSTLCSRCWLRGQSWHGAGRSVANTTRWHPTRPRSQRRHREDGLDGDFFPTLIFEARPEHDIRAGGASRPHVLGA